MSIQQTATVAERFSLSPRAEPWRLRDRPPYVCGYVWRSAAPKAALLLLHGLQSHAQWFVEAGQMLSDLGLTVYAIDRRGSGSSPGVRGDIGDYHEWFAEVDELLQAVRRETPETPAHLLGHCFGANIALGYALANPGTVASVVALTPGLFVLPDYSLAERLHIAVCGLLRPQTRFRVPQDDELFTRDPEMLAWIEADTLGAKTVTARCLLQTHHMLGRLRRDLKRLTVPMLVLEAARDRLSDNRRNRAAIQKALGGRCTWLTFEGEHFLLGEPCRDAVLDAIAAWAGGAGVSA